MKKFQVGDKVTLTNKDGESVEGTIIDFDIYYGDQIVFKIIFPSGEVDIDEKQLTEILSKRK